MAQVDIKAMLAGLEWTHRANPSLARKLCDALRSVSDGLQTLASHGHGMHLEPGPITLPDWPWPRTYYHWEHGHREVLGPGHLAELGPGWYQSPSQAEQAHGEDVQFAGRGGVRRQRQVTVGNGSAPVWVPFGPSKADLVAKFRSGRVDLGPIKSDSKVEN